MLIEIHITTEEGQPPQPDRQAIRKRKRKRRLKLLVWIVGILVIARILLPYVVLYFANRKLASLEGYYGHIDDIDISLYRGAYSIKRLELRKIDKKDTFDFVYAKTIDLAIEWKPIWHGQLVGKVAIDSCNLVYTEERNDWRDIAKDTANFRDVMNSFMPLTLNKLEVNNSTIRYKDPYKSPRLDIPMRQIHLVALNLVNAYDSATVLPATIDATGRLYKGTIEMHLKTDPFSRQSKFDMNTSIRHVNMEALNNLLRAYAHLDVNKGNFDVYMEFAAKDGRVKGYVKPIIKDLDVVTWNKSEGKLGQILWESVVEAGAWVFKNHAKDQLGTKIYIEGKMKDPKVSIGKAILILLQNAFVVALKPYIDGEISIGSVQSSKDKANFIDKALAKHRQRKHERAAKKRSKQKGG